MKWIEMLYPHLPVSYSNYDHHTTVTIIIWPLRSFTAWSLRWLRSSEFGRYDHLTDNFSIKNTNYYDSLASRTYQVKWPHFLSTFDTKNRSVNRLSLTQSTIVYSHRSRPSPSWMIVTAADRNWWCTVLMVSFDKDSLLWWADALATWQRNRVIIGSDEQTSTKYCRGNPRKNTNCFTWPN